MFDGRPAAQAGMRGRTGSEHEPSTTKTTVRVPFRFDPRAASRRRRTAFDASARARSDGGGSVTLCLCGNVLFVTSVIFVASEILT
jgi:hypothetical protein